MGLVGWVEGEGEGKVGEKEREKREEIFKLVRPVGKLSAERCWQGIAAHHVVLPLVLVCPVKERGMEERQQSENVIHTHTHDEKSELTDTSRGNPNN